jgi:hypothetical protein
MAILVYPSGKAAIANGGIDLDTSDLRVQPVQAAYTSSVAHANLSDVPVGQRTGTAAALASRTIITPTNPNTNARAMDAADTSLGTLAAAGNALVIYLHTGVEATSTLLAYIDGISWTAGQAVTAQWSTDGIFFLN